MRRQKYPNGYPGRTVSDRSDTVGACLPIVGGFICKVSEAAPGQPPPAPVVDPCGRCGHARERHFRNRGTCDVGVNPGEFMQACACPRWTSPPKRTVSDRSDTVSLPLAGAEEWVGKPGGKSPKKKSPAASPMQLKSAEVGFEEIRKSKEWDLMEPRHFLGLYIVCHRRVYGTDPADLFAQWAGAIGAVRAMLKHEFGDDSAKMVAFCQWAWSREQARERQRRSNGGGDFRMAWRFLFVRQAAAGMLTDWRTSLARAANTRTDVKAAQ